MSRVVHVVDYGVGNLHSVSRAVEKVGGIAQLTSDPALLKSAERIILPGVGAFKPCIDTLRESGLAEAIASFARNERPFLGICVGMQVLFDYSLEFGRHEGLGLIPGHVAPIPGQDQTGSRKVPHIGWSPLLLPAGRTDWSGSLLAEQSAGRSSAYFVHSYSCLPSDAEHRLAEVNYADYPICAAVQSGNIIGCQFHPEKSGEVGLRILSAFLAH